MKMFLSRTLVVEGKEDVSYLSNYVSSEIVMVNGYEIKKSIVNYLKEKSVILLLDPDDAGKTIREKLHHLLNDYIDIEIDISSCNRGKKTGVAECEISEILPKLAPFCINNPVVSSEISKYDLYKFGLMNNKELRSLVCEKLNLGSCNGKQLYKRLLINSVSYNKLEEIVKECQNGN